MKYYIKVTVSIAIFALIIVVVVGKNQQYNSVPISSVPSTIKTPHSWKCEYRDNKYKNRTFTMQMFNGYILIDGKYKVFYRGEKETPPLGDWVSIYTNKGYTYDVMYDDGMYFMGVQDNYSERRIAWCKY